MASLNSLNSSTVNSSPLFDSLSKLLSPVVYKKSIYNDVPNFNSVFNSNDLNGISLLHLNIRSANKNMDVLKLFLSTITLNFDIIVLSEIWNKNLSIIANSLTGYKFFSKTPPQSIVGGIGIFIRDNVKAKLLSSSCNYSPLNAVENLWLLINHNGFKCLLGGFYRHPGDNISDFLSSFEADYLSVSTKCPRDCNVLIAGDFNIDLCKLNESNHIKNYVENLTLLGLFPIINNPTRCTPISSTIIDHIYLNISNNSHLSYDNGIFDVDLTDHFPSYAILRNTIHRHCYQSRPYIRSFSESNKIKFAKEVALIDWDLFDFYSISDVNSLYDKFILTISSIFCKCFPLVRQSRKSFRQKSWITRELQSSSFRKTQLFKLSKKIPTSENIANYKLYKKKHDLSINVAKSNYYAELFDKNKKNTKLLWNEINNICNLKGSTKSNKSIEKIITSDNTILVDNSDISNYFNEYFTSIGPTLADNIPVNKANFSSYLNKRVSESIFLHPVTPGELSVLLHNLDGNTSPGHDNISPKFIKLISNSIMAPLLHIYNTSLCSGLIPDALKVAKVIPLFKGGDIEKADNYRPISLLDSFGKILEKLVCNRLISFLDKHIVISPNQYGFRKNLSTELALTDVTNSIYTALNKNNYVMALYVDLKKAFDTVNYDILLHKLEFYGVRGIALTWFRNYLTDRKQFTFVNNVSSTVSCATTGVPQGSILGPVLFLIYINDIENSVVNSNIKMFADDTNLFFINQNLALLFNHANDQVMELHKWLIANKLTLNLSKTNFSIFCPTIHKRPDLNLFHLCLDGKEIPYTKCVKYLGVLIDDDLSWKSHIAHLKSTLLPILYIIYKVKHFLNAWCLKSIYFAYVESHIAYCSSIYTNTAACNLSQLKILNNKLLRAAQCKGRKYNLVSLYMDYNVLPLESRLNYKFNLHMFQVLFMHESLPSFLQHLKRNCDIHRYSTRFALSIFHENILNRFGFRRFEYLGPQFWSSLPFDPSVLTFNNFSVELKNHLLSVA